MGNDGVIAQGTKTKKAGKTRGLPFARGKDPRRNTKGRGKRPKRDDAIKELRNALMSLVITVNRGRHRKVPMVRAIADKYLAEGAQGDLAAMRAAAGFFRSVDQLYRHNGQNTSDHEDDGADTDHDMAGLRRILRNYTREVAARTRAETRKRKKGEE